MYVNPNILGLHRLKSEEGRGNYIRLDMNENPDGLPKPFVDRVLETITSELLAMYPETDELIALLAKHINLPEASIALTNGSDEALKTIFTVYGESGKKLVLVTPTFAMYSIYAQMAGMSCSFVPYRKDLTVSLFSILDNIDSQTGIISLVNPNNPMGNVYSADQIEKVLQKAAEHHAIVIVDEAYHYFYPKTCADLVKQYNNLVVTRTFSKLCSIAGLRIGYAVSDANNISLINAARPTYCINTMAIQFAKAILEDSELIPSLIATEREGKKWILNKLNLAGYHVVCREGNFLFIETKTPPLLLQEKLKKHFVLVKTYDNPYISNYIRVNTGRVDTMQKFWNIFIKLEEAGK